MSEKERRDPLAELFSNVQLTGLSKPVETPTGRKPLSLDFIDDSPVRSPQKVDTSLKRPKRPPRYEGEPYESYASDIEIEELESDEDVVEKDVEVSVGQSEQHTPSENMADNSESPEKVAEKQSTPSLDALPAKVRLAMIQQQMQRQRMAIKKQQQEAQEKSQPVSEAPPVVVPPKNIEDSVAKINSKMSQQEKAPSAMELFLAAAAESEQAEKSKKQASVSPTKKSPPVSAESVLPSATTDQTSPKPLMGNRLILSIEEMIRSQLPLLKKFHVASALDSFDRPLMRAIWRSHRTKFLMNGQLEYAVSAVSVIDAFEQIAEGQLIAAYVETTASDYLIWIDLPNQRLVAAFADAKSYFAN